MSVMEEIKKHPILDILDVLKLVPTGLNTEYERKWLQEYDEPIEGLNCQKLRKRKLRSKRSIRHIKCESSFRWRPNGV